MKITGKIAILVLLIGILLTACSGAEATPTADPGAVYTMAAATVQAQLTEIAAQNPTPEPPTPTIPAPTEAPTPLPTIEVAMQPTPPFGAEVVVVPTLSGGLNPNLQPTSAQPAGFKFGDVAEFQYNIPGDGTIYFPGIHFQAETGFKNVGSVTWTTDYKLIFTGGAQFSGVTSVPLTKSVSPGEKAIFNLAFKAPGEPNNANNPHYLSYWRLVTQTGAPVANGDMYWKIIVKKE